MLGVCTDASGPNVPIPRVNSRLKAYSLFFGTTLPFIVIDGELLGVKAPHSKRLKAIDSWKLGISGRFQRPRAASNTVTEGANQAKRLSKAGIEGFYIVWLGLNA